MAEVRQRSVALILVRELAENLSTPVLVVDESGMLVYYNEPAELIIGSPFHEIGVVGPDDWPDIQPQDADGNPVPMEQFPLTVAVREQRATHDEFFMIGLDGERRRIAATGFPLFGRGGAFVGAVAVFWELGR